MSDHAKDVEPGTSSSEAAAPVYRVLARKYRPQVFDDLIGQEAMVQTLTNGFATGRIAQAFMLTGVRGIGKTTTARLIARALNYSLTDKPSVDMPEMGEHCAAILESRHVDVIEMDAASRTGIDDVREIIESVRYRPSSARYKVYIIDEVHMLSNQAFNALLKTLEEPPAHVKFIFATTEIRKVPVTVLSRCQRFDLQRLDPAVMMQHLATIAGKENVSIDEESLRMIARAAEGSVRDGLSLLDQAIAFGGDAVKADDVQSMLGLVDRGRIADLFEAVMKGDTASSLKILEEQHQGGGDPQTILSDLAEFVHWVSRIKIVGDERDMARTADEQTRGKQFAEALAMPDLTRAWQMLLKGLGEVAQSPNALMAAEMVLIRLAYASGLPSPADLVKSLQGRSNGGTQAPVRGAETSGGAPSPAPQAMRSMPPTEMPDRANVTQAALATDRNQADASSSAEAGSGARFNSFDDIIAYVDAKRDLILKRHLANYVRPIRVSPGQIEMALEPDAPADIAQKLGRRMEAWTGERWMVSIAPSGGDEPLARQQAAARQSLFAKVRQHEDVRAVLETFPGAEIINVTQSGPDEIVPADEDPDQE